MSPCARWKRTWLFILPNTCSTAAATSANGAPYHTNLALPSSAPRAAARSWPYIWNALDRGPCKTLCIAVIAMLPPTRGYPSEEELLDK